MGYISPGNFALFHTPMGTSTIKDLPNILRDFAIYLALKAYSQNPGSKIPPYFGKMPDVTSS
jgi:hypothetical protein